MVQRKLIGILTSIVLIPGMSAWVVRHAIAETKESATTRPADPAIAPDGLVVDLDAEKGVELEDGKVASWKNQIQWKAMDFVGKRVNGRPSVKKAVPEAGGHDTLDFEKQELVNYDEDAFDHFITGQGYTWLAVLTVHQQVEMEKDVDTFFGNLKNGGNFEGFWGGVNDDNTIWMGSRNGITFGRWDENNPKVAGPKLEMGKFYVIGGRMDAGTGEVKLELFVNDAKAVASKPIKVNPKADSSKMAIGQERDATNHPGRESFKGEIARILFWDRPLPDSQLTDTFEALKKRYKILGAAGQ